MHRGFAFAGVFKNVTGEGVLYSSFNLNIPVELARVIVTAHHLQTGLLIQFVSGNCESQNHSNLIYQQTDARHGELLSENSWKSMRMLSPIITISMWVGGVM